VDSHGHTHTKAEESESSGGWGFFAWYFLLLFLALIIAAIICAVVYYMFETEINLLMGKRKLNGSKLYSTWPRRK